MSQDQPLPGVAPAPAGSTAGVPAPGLRPEMARRLHRLPENTDFLDLLGVTYARMSTADGGELYLTRYGLHFWEHLQPENWYARDWFESKRERLVGTSTVYKVPTRSVRGAPLDLVVKWSRVGEEVPLDTMTINKFINADFNSPFEEFSLVMELRAGQYGPPGIRLYTQKPLAIYVPSERLQLWQTGRSESKIAAKLARAPGVEIDILRQYVVLYGWVKGYDAVEAADAIKLTGEPRQNFLASLTNLVIHELEMKGYRVIDMKPQHVIVRLQPDKTLLRDEHGQVVYALIDYELLERTPEHEQSVRSLNRQHYLKHMARRFEASSEKPLPTYLKSAKVLGVDYIHGHAESTGGTLWVVGKDPDLFNYFLPERWRRTPKRDLAPGGAVYHTHTKDNINLVWKISRVGSMPASPRNHPRVRDILQHGYNSPFEEFAHALTLSQRGVRTVYPRAIYMTGHAGAVRAAIGDGRRYAAMEEVRGPNGELVLPRDQDFIVIWGFWNGPDELLAARDGQFYRSINGEEALHDGLITPDQLRELMDQLRERMAHGGFEDLNLKPDHLLLSFAPDHVLVRDTCGRPEVRLCNFELVRALG